MVNVAEVVKSIVRPHVSVVEIETEYGYRFWSEPMPDVSVGLYIQKNTGYHDSVSDVDCSTTCWCFPIKMAAMGLPV